MKNKKLIFIILIIIALIIGGVIGYFTYKNSTANKENTGTDWGDQYYSVLISESKKQTVIDSVPGKTAEEKEYDRYADTKNVKVAFLQSSEEDVPKMIITYEKETKKCVNIYHLEKSTNENNKYDCYVDYHPDVNNDTQNNLEYDIQVLYNIEEQQYIWYLHHIYESGGEKKEYFYPVFNEITNLKGEKITSKEYVFTEEEMKTNQTDENGNAILSKFEQTFIRIDDVDLPMTDIGDIHNIEPKELIKYLKTAITSSKNNDKIITEEIKTATENKVKEIENKKEQIRIAAEEKAKKEAEEKAKAEEEAKIKAEEEAKKKAEEGLKVGNYTLKYGTYKGTDGQYDGEGVTNWNVSINIKSDGTYTLTSSNTSMQPNSSGTYQITNVTGKPGIQLSKGGIYEVIANNKLQVPAGSGAIFSYQGN